MEIGIRIFIFSIVLFKASLVSAYYSKYYVEDRCIHGNETIVYNTAEEGSAGILRATAYPPYAPDKNCVIIIKPPEGQGVVLSIRKIDLRPKRFYVCRDYIQVFYSDPFGSPATICRFKFDLKEETSYYSKGPMKIIYHTGPREDLHYEEGFTLTFTAASEDLSVCSSDEKFMCGNSRCVWKALTCDGRNNCGDNSDEVPMLCDVLNFYDFRLTDIIYTISMSLVIIITLTSILMVCRHRKRRNTIRSGMVFSDPPTDGPPTPYQAVHPSGYFICQNPAGPPTLLPHHNSKDIHSEGGFSNPCYPTGIPQTLYPSKV